MSPFNSSDDQNTDLPIWQNRRIIFASLGGILLIAALLTYFFTRSAWEGLRFYLTFDDVNGLSKGNAVYISGLQIGQVTNLTLLESGVVQVEILISNEYADQMRQGSIFQIIDMPAGSGPAVRAISIDIIIPTSPRVKPDQTLAGANDSLEAFFQTATMLGPDLADKYLKLGEYRVNTAFTHNRIVRSFALESGLLIPQELFFSNVLPSGPTWYRSMSHTERTRLITISGEFAHVEEAQWIKSQLQFESQSNWFWTDYSYRESFPESEFLRAAASELDGEHATVEDLLVRLTTCAANPEACITVIEECIADPSACISELLNLAQLIFEPLKRILEEAQGIPAQNLHIQFTVQMPGQIVETNAFVYNDNTASWNFTGAELNQGVTLTAKSREYNSITIWGSGLGFLVTIGGGVVIWRRRAATVSD